MSNLPALSVVITTPEKYESIRLTVRHLRAQTVRDKIELVIVGPDESSISPPPSDVAGFCACKILAIGEVKSIGRANAAGIRQASAPVVALAEDHCFPAPGWAEALIDAHRGPWAVVGPVIQNANPVSMVSWSDFIIGYGPWMYPAPAGSPPFLPGHNSSYKKSVLLEYGDRLEDFMEAETLLHIDLRHRGYQLYLEPRAQAFHTNFGLASSWFRVQFYAGRVFGASRARNWNLLKRLIYFAASPLIPGVRLWRCLRELMKPGRPSNLIPRILPALSFGLLLDGLGQMAGYLFGVGDALDRVAQYEFHRFRHISEQERRAAEALAQAV